MRTWLLCVTACLFAGFSFVAGSACGDDGDSDADAVETAIRAFEKAWNDQDYDAFLAVHTDQGLRAQLADSEQDLSTDEGRREAFRLFAGDDKAIISKIGNIDVDGERATAKVEGYNESREEPAPSSVLLGISFALVKEQDDWKIDALEFASPEVPDGVEIIQVQANEFAFALQDEPGDGNIAFQFENVGNQQHHVVIEKVPEDLNIEAALESDDEPEGLVHIGATPPWEPGTTATVVFTEELDPGRYVMLCFMPDTDDPEGTPHTAKGMWKEFEIE